MDKNVLDNELILYFRPISYFETSRQNVVLIDVLSTLTWMPFTRPWRWEMIPPYDWNLWLLAAKACWWSLIKFYFIHLFFHIIQCSFLLYFGIWILMFGEEDCLLNVTFFRAFVFVYFASISSPKKSRLIICWT